MKPDAQPLARAKLFQHGRSQAVRLPKEFRFEGTEVYVRRVGNDVVLSSLPKASMQNLIEALDDFEPGFVMERSQPEEVDERAPLSKPQKKPQKSNSVK
jgi:antitoxin VapB